MNSDLSDYPDHQDHFVTLNAIRLPRVIRAVAIMLVLCLVIAAVFMALVPWTQTTSGAGSVTAINPNDRLQDINALVSGRIQEWYVRDGSHVSAGDPIVRIADNDPQLIQRLEAERDQVLAKLEATQSAVRIADLDLQRTQGLFEQGLAARRDVEQAKIKIEELRSKVAEAAGEMSRVDINISRQSVQIVRAPRNGLIMRVNAGDSATYISAGTAVATFIPDDVERAVEIFIDGRDVALITPGAKVRIQFEGWPAVQFSGWPQVAVGTFGGEVIAIDPSAQANGRFRVLVVEDKASPDQWPDDRFVRFGSVARGWILLETVTVGYELWRQLNNFPPNFAEDSSSAGANTG